LAENRVYEVMYIADPTTDGDTIKGMNEEITALIENAGGTIVNTDDMGLRQLAYKIKQFTQGYYFLFEIEGSGREIAELERRMRVNDKIFRYLTVRVDEERKTAAKIEAKREKRKEKLNSLLNKGNNSEESTNPNQ
jgi:small subunit ribosomal protein S6